MSIHAGEPCGDGVPDLLLREITHRFFNSLQVIDVLLDRLVREPTTLQTVGRNVGSLRQRVHGLSELHRKLAMLPESRGLLEDHCRGVCADLVSTFGRDDVTVQVCMEPAPLGSDQELRLVLLVVELVTNALKYGRSAANMVVWVDMAACGTGELKLMVRDNGLSSSLAVMEPQVAGALARSLGGELRVSTVNGFSACVAFPTTSEDDTAARVKAR